jgi:hypothetical protein
VTAELATPHSRKGAVSVMLAAQQLPELPSLHDLELLAKLIAALPPWLAAVTVISLAVVVGLAYGVPRLIRAVGDYRVVTKASDIISTEDSALEALRITHPERRRLNLPTRRTPDGPDRQGAPPESTP